jgi:propionyl-CoA carboxylase alpha chain
MNTRLQVEHPVTELITGLDLVEQMIRVAAGEPLAFVQDGLKIDGWAVESRIYAEDPYRKFLPSIGRLVRYAPPTEGARDGFEVRNDSGVREGDEISMFYDPMIAKLCTHAATRDAAVAGMGQALEDFLIEGVGHNIPFLAAVMDQARFRSGQLSTSYIADEFPDGFHGAEPTPAQIDLMAAAAVWMHRTQVVRAGHAGGATFPRKSRREWVVAVGEAKHAVQVDGDDARLSITFADGRTIVLDKVNWRPGRALFHGRLDGVDFAAEVAPAAEGFTIRHRAAKTRVLVLTPLSAELHDRLPKRAPADTSKIIVSPMPGLMVSVDVVVGQEVKAGETVAVIEAMKMQNILRAERDGVIKSVGPKAGDSVAADEVLVEFA